MMTGLQAFLLAAAVLVAGAAAVPLSGWTAGTASFYGGPANSSVLDTNSSNYKLTIDSGSCGYGDIDPRLFPFYNVVGLHNTNALVAGRPMSACGSCLEVQCVGGHDVCNNNNRPIQVLVTDQCVYNCDANNINIHVFGFEQIAPLRIGRTNIRYRLIECEPADPIIIHIMDYRATEGGWIRLALKNIAGDAALRSVEIGSKGASGVDWMACTNTYGGVWEAGLNGVALPLPPLDLRITNTLQQQVIITNFVAFAGMTGDVETTGQFPSPYGDDAGTSTGNAAPLNPANGGDSSSFLLPVPKKTKPSVTVGMAIVKPKNTLYGRLPPSNSSSAAITQQNDASKGLNNKPAASPAIKSTGSGGVFKASSFNLNQAAPQPVMRSVPLGHKAPGSPAPAKASPAPHKSPALVTNRTAAMRRPASPHPHTSNTKVTTVPSSAPPAPQGSASSNAPVVLTGNTGGKQVVVNKQVLTVGSNRRMLVAP